MTLNVVSAAAEFKEDIDSQILELQEAIAELPLIAASVQSLEEHTDVEDEEVFMAVNYIETKTRAVAEAASVVLHNLQALKAR